MLMIVLCHIIGNYTFIPGHGFLSQILNVGVYSFLAISGYLYGGKTIADFRCWFYKRWQTVLLPAWILIAAVLLAECILGNQHDLRSVVLYFLNLQGAGFLVYDFYRYFTEIPALGPIWFLTIIMLCYCIVPLLQKYRQKLCDIKHGYLWAVGVATAFYALDVFAGINLLYFLTFTLGYCMAARGTEAIASRKYGILLTVLMVALQIFRLVLQYGWDGLPVYQSYTLVSHMVLGVWILWVFLAWGQYAPKCTERIAEYRWMIALNDISFYVYLTHCCFCRGRLDLYQLTDHLSIATIAFVAATLISAVMLKSLARLILRKHV
jgi:peptidoglycan/LPS O-acetylase OafA/YrhL